MHGGVKCVKWQSIANWFQIITGGIAEMWPGAGALFKRTVSEEK